MLPATYRRPDWYQYFDNVARAIGGRGTCPRARVGAVVVDWNRKAVLATGYNGAPTGMPHCDDEGCRIEDNHCIRTVHAETNAIIAARRAGVNLDGAVVFVNIDGPATVDKPCESCEHFMRRYGITRWYVNANAD